MKTLLIIDSGLGQARAYMAKTLLGAAANKTHLEITDNPGEAELAIVLGDKLPADSALNGKKVWLGDINRAVAHPELFLSEAKGHGRVEENRQRTEDHHSRDGHRHFAGFRLHDRFSCQHRRSPADTATCTNQPAGLFVQPEHFLADKARQ